MDSATKQESPEESSTADRTAVVTRLLEQARSGDPRAAGELLPLVYGQLRELARVKLRHERPDLTLQATALVHEAYLRLVGRDGRGGRDDWDGRRHFLAAAAEAMRRILVDQARRRRRLKRGGAGRRRLGQDAAADVPAAVPPDRAEDLLALDEALTALATQHPEKARLVNLRYFAGLTIELAADTIGISPATAERHWAFARAWLYRRMSGGDPGATGAGGRRRRPRQNP